MMTLGTAILGVKAHAVIRPYGPCGSDEDSALLDW